MTTPARHTDRPRWVLAFLAAVLAVALGAFAATPASAATASATQNAVGAFDSAARVAVELSASISAGQRLGNSPPQPGIVVATGVAANTGATLSGRTVLGEGWDAAIRSARNATPEAGYFDVVAHGTPNAVFDAARNALSPSQLAGVVRGTPSWAGQDVRLLSCSTGCPTGSFAQSLANELGVGVKAPTTDFLVNSRGGVVFDPGGSWSFFPPGG